MGKVSTIRAWMTVPAISRIYHVPEDYMYRSLEISSPASYHHVTLYEIANRKHQPVDQVIHTLQHAILIYRQQHPGITNTIAGVSFLQKSSSTRIRESRTLNAFFISALQQYGYPALWLIIFVAAIGAPISGNLLLYAAGAFVAFGDFNIFILFPVAVSAAVLGDNLGYFIGRWVGTPLLSWFERQKRFQFISPTALARGRAYFRSKTAWAIFISRFFIVALGGPINFLAGIEQYPFRNFLLWDVCGQILGAAIPLSLGYIFAESWEEVAGILGAFSGLFLAFLTAILLFRSPGAKNTPEEGLYRM